MMYDFGFGEIPAHKHENGGGIVADRATVADKAFVGKRARISGGVMHGGEMHGGVMWGGVMWGGVMWGGVMWGGEMHGGVMRGGEMHGGEMRGGEMRGGEMWGGVMWGGVFTQSPSCAQRSDGYMFIVKMVGDELRVWAGCRNFSWDEAVAHWDNTDHPHHEESMRIIEFLKVQELEAIS